MSTKFLDPDLLREIIREKERGYVNTLVNLFLYPRFIELCERDMADPNCSAERHEALTQTITSHRVALSGEQQSLETWELLLDHLYSLHPDVPCNRV
ncbi:MAG TPA: hypothetical protein PK765_06320 [bacterium]|nr:hypothetical protein [bacterium]